MGDKIAFKAVVTEFVTGTSPFNYPHLVNSAGTVSSQKATWSSSDPNILSIDPTTGEAEALAGGTVTVTAKAGDATAECSVTIAPDVYIIGYENNDNYNAVATVWKNGEPMHMSSGNLSTVAKDAFIDGQDVYVAGYETNSNYTNVAKVWKNGTELYSLTNGSDNGEAVSVVVKDGVVYTVGNSVDESGIKRATLWKNGEPTFLKGEDDSFQTDVAKNGSALIIQDGKVYVAGTTAIGFFNFAPTVWIDGVPTTYEEGVGAITLSSFTIHNGDIYLAGTLNEGGVGVAATWKNGKLTRISDGTVVNEAYSIAFIGEKMYVACGRLNMSTFKGEPYIWSDNEVTTITDGSYNAYTLGIATMGSDTYLCGTKLNETTYNNEVFMWKNGEFTQISDGSHYTYVYKILLH